MSEKKPEEALKEAYQRIPESVKADLRKRFCGLCPLLDHGTLAMAEGARRVVYYILEKAQT